MFRYKVVFTLLGAEHNMLVMAHDSDSALATVFELHEDASNVKLWQAPSLQLINPAIPDNVIRVDFKLKKRIA